MSYVVSEYEGYSNRHIETWTFKTFAEAEKFWKKMVDGNKYAGVGGQWRHYFSYPQER